ncbi:predicted protein [Scheffersomyces stipitis CBS 6054]|uniref:Pore membrane protein of 33 kDa n=1 Tax=Scheffersomyces stipitis (strain ATCC 58785 / CBS 6054 / NBRC 10063 / NRRL Y-11545) TaxID=322104 RepID=A3LXE0_PICST|nr:predicted protein [Scheffersomyces stipitis CBS 6054]ABN67792.2 predicted protein [Scheffersomyces stipitis CBS 6054]KAG2732127.1 hypothetical protein G9P44_004544 [Scheffersomyces stipitis]
MSTPSNTAATPASSAKFDQEKLLATVKTSQFAWFVGHLVTLISVFFYVLTYIKFGVGLYKFWFVLALVGVVESFGILVFQSIKKNGFDFGQLIKDDNTFYFLLGSLLLFVRSRVLLTLLPFGLFSFYHVLTYANGYILPIFNLENSAISSKIGSFVANTNNKSIQLAALLEVVTYGYLFLRVIAFRKRSLSPFLIYTVFLKKKFETSVYTRNYFKAAEVQVDNVVNQIGQPQVKKVWIQIKDVFKKIGTVHLVHDPTKDKSI